MTERPTWTVEILFSEDDERTHATAHLRAGSRELIGWGRARRNPVDPVVPVVGEELAASRALVDLGHQLLSAAFEAIDTFATASSTTGGRT